MVSVECTYFEKPGPGSTEEVLKIARQRAEELDISTVLVASVTGETAVKTVRAFENFNVVVVTLATGRYKPDVQEFQEQNREIVEKGGGKILTTTQAFSGVSRAMRDALKTCVIGDIIANSLRIFGHGMKVACEITLMAADAGLVRTEESVIVIAGTTRGADTAVVIRPANAQRFFDLRVQEILCKPYL